MNEGRKESRDESWVTIFWNSHRPSSGRGQTLDLKSSAFETRANFPRLMKICLGWNTVKTQSRRTDNRNNEISYLRGGSLFSYLNYFTVLSTNKDFTLKEKKITIILQQEKLSSSAHRKQEHEFFIYARWVLVLRERILGFETKNSSYDNSDLLFSLQEITFTAVYHYKATVAGISQRRKSLIWKVFWSSCLGCSVHVFV